MGFNYWKNRGMVSIYAGVLSLAQSAHATERTVPIENTDWDKVGDVASGATQLASEASSQLLAEWSLDKTPQFKWGFASVFSSLNRVRIAFGPTAGFNTGPALFDNVDITTATIGTGFIADASNDPDFPVIASQLTNGVSTDRVYVVTGTQGFGAAAANQPESFWASNPSAPSDFQGATITSIELFVTHFDHTSPGTNPNGDGNWTDFHIDRELRIYGTIPEPATGFLVAAGAVLLRRVRR